MSSLMENYVSMKHIGLKVLCVNLRIATCGRGLQSRAIALNLFHVCISLKMYRWFMTRMPLNEAMDVNKRVTNRGSMGSNQEILH